MQRAPRLVCSALLASCWAAVASAEIVEYKATETIEIPIPDIPDMVVTHVSPGIVNGSAGGSHLTTLLIFPLVPFTETVDVPSTHFLSHVLGITAFEVQVSGPGVIFTGISNAVPSTLPQLPDGEWPWPGALRLCLLVGGCDNGFVDVPLTENGTRGVGIGGIVTAVTGTSPNFFRITLEGAPWTPKPVQVLVATENGGTTVVTATGVQHGPASLTSSTALPSGVFSLVTPIEIETDSPFGPGAKRIGLIGRFSMHVVPEPQLVLLLGAGAAGLLLLARKRMH